MKRNKPSQVKNRWQVKKQMLQVKNTRVIKMISVVRR
jgi:hypothetical protein